VLLVRGKSRLDGLVGDDVAVGKVFGEDAGAGLLLLLDVVVAALASSAEAAFSPAISSMDFAEETCTELGPSCVLSSSKAVFAAAVFSKVTEAVWASLPEGFTLMDWILPQKLKNDLISSSLVFVLMLETLTVLAIL